MMQTGIRTICCCIAVGAIFYFGDAHAQNCPGGQAYSTVSYDTTAVGNGNNVYKLPQFDPSIGTLHSVDFSSEIYFTLAYTLVNINSGVQDRTINLRRRDLLNATSPSNPTPFPLLPTAWYEESFEHDAFSLGAVPPGTTNYKHEVFDPRIITRSFDQGVVDFMGSDSLYLTYTTITQNALGFGSPDVTMPATTVYDSMIFRVTYNYCATSALPSTDLTLTASKYNDKTLLHWSSLANPIDGTYEILKSTDGRTYTSVVTQAISRNNYNNYKFIYTPVREDNGKAFFRVKQTDKNGNITYSKVITVLLPKDVPPASVANSSTLKVFPTLPTDFINVVIPENNIKDEWKISIIAASGAVIQQATVKNRSIAKINFQTKLSQGLYIVDAVNTRTQEHYKNKIVVQP